MSILSRVLLKALLGLALLAPVLASRPVSAEPRRVLHVSLYPYIPDAAAAALALKQGFERLHPDVIVDVSFNANYYSARPADHGVLYEDADIHEIDVVFMRDFLARRKLQSPAASWAQTGVTPLPLAQQAATYDGAIMAVPHWMCADFLIYRADKTGLDSARSLAGIEAALRPDGGLLLNMKGRDQLGELYLTSLIAGTDAAPSAILASLSPTPDPAILARLQRILALEPPGLGRDAAYGEVEGFYARQFARRTGSAFVGYSELIHDVLEETATGCRTEDRCVAADEIRVTSFPFADDKVRPNVWVDMFAIDARVHGRTLADARAFIRYAVSTPAYRALLVPPTGEIPRYLLPATAAAFNDPRILAAAPLYPQFRAILEQGVVVTAPHLDAALHDVAERIDAALPRTR